MERLKFPQPMHPSQEHNYTVDWTEQLDALSDTLTGTPTVVVDPDSVTPAGMVISGQTIDGTSKKALWHLAVGVADREDPIYKGGATVCFLVTCATVGSDAMAQQVELVIDDQC